MQPKRCRRSGQSCKRGKDESKRSRTEFNVPKSSKDRRSKGGLSPFAAQTVSSQPNELLIVELIGHLSDFGLGLDKTLFLSLIDEYLKKNNQLDLFVKVTLIQIFATDLFQGALKN